MRVVFLDVDGVLNCMPRTWDEGHVPRLQPECVARLARLVESTDARICVSSTWRVRDGYRKLVGWLVERGIARDRFVGKTPWAPGDVAENRRGWEIAAWLAGRSDVDAFVILDDDGDMGALAPMLVKTHHVDGLTDEDVARAIAVLEAQDGRRTGQGREGVAGSVAGGAVLREGDGDGL